MEELFILIKLSLLDIISGVLQTPENQLLEARLWRLRGWLTNVP